MLKKIQLSMLFAFIGLVFISGFAEAQTVEDGKTVKFNYTLTVDGKIIENSFDAEPLEYVHGNSMIVPGLEKGLAGMKVGEKKNIVIQPEEAYGEVNPEALVEFGRSGIPPGTEIKKGAIVQVKGEDGSVFSAIIEEIKDDVLVLNFNHPMAGKVLTFYVEIVSVD